MKNNKERAQKLKGIKIPVLILIFLLPSALSGMEIRIGRSAGWEQVRTVERTAFRVPGEKDTGTSSSTINFEESSQRVLTLQEASYTEEEHTDLLLHLDRPGGNIAGPYEIELEGAEFPGTRKMFGTGAALFRRKGDEVRLMPRDAALFAPDTLWKDFTIEFWLRPQYLEQGETIMLWQGSRQIHDRIDPQEMRVYISGRGVVWRFDNIFLPPDRKTHSVEIKGRSVLVPEQWHHHSLQFDAETGMLLYRLDGKDEAVTYLTGTKKEGGTVLLPYIGGPNPEPLLIGSEYTGFLDEFRISRKIVENPVLKPYPLKRGSAETIPLDLGAAHSRIVSIQAASTAEGLSDIRYFYRQSNTKEQYDQVEGEWLPFVPGEPFPPSRSGRFLQLRFELFPDGTGMKAPMLSEIQILYETDTPPVPPSLIELRPGDGSMQISWNSVSAHDLSGYLVFYGKAPDTYQGSDAAEGESPVDTGKETSVTLTGLENGTIYFFRVAAYDNEDPSNPGPLSREAAGRPERQPDRKGPQ